MARGTRILVQILLGGLLLRAVALRAQSLWLDEAVTWANATHPTWGGTLFAESNHPPVWWLLTRAWVGVFGESEQSLRMPAALLGVVAIWLAYLLALRLFDPARTPRRGGWGPRVATPEASRTARGLALWFAGFMAASAYFTEYAQEARMYPLMLVEGLGLALLYLRWLDTGRWQVAAAYAALGALAMHTHYYAIWIFAAHGVHLLWTRWRPLDEGPPVRILPMVLAIGAVGLSFLPWFLHFLSVAKRSARAGSTTRSHPSATPCGAWASGRRWCSSTAGAWRRAAWRPSRRSCPWPCWRAPSGSCRSCWDSVPCGGCARPNASCAATRSCRSCACCWCSPSSA